ncbi:MAG: type II toxin-antitoxin system PemK/MazF family toxin [Bacteroidetes bacterium]|nr:type II toxin-antitoxin system PemK/MazF family toxin [Bacteroidota bacterium]
MRQRDIYLAGQDPAIGTEQQGVRPVVIISGDALNEMTELCIICPLTTKIKNYPGSVVISKNKQNGLSDDSEILIFQVRVIAKKRLVRKIGAVTESELVRIKQGLTDVLTF